MSPKILDTPCGFSVRMIEFMINNGNADRGFRIKSFCFANNVSAYIIGAERRAP